MRRVLKVGAFIVRPARDGGHHLLLFTHPDFPEAPIQIPGGTVEAGEAVEAALDREILEETGLTGLSVLRKLGVSEVPSIANESEVLVRHCYLLEAPPDVTESWIHVVAGNGLDEGLRFAFGWHRIEPGFTLTGDLGYFLSPEHLPEIYT